MLRKENPVGRGRCRCRCCCSFFRRLYWSQWCLKRCCSIGRRRIFCILLPAPGPILGHFARWFLLLPPRPVPCFVLLGASSRRLRSRCLRSWVLKLTWILEVRRSDPWTCHCAQWTWDGHPQHLAHLEPAAIASRDWTRIWRKWAMCCWSAEWCEEKML